MAIEIVPNITMFGKHDPRKPFKAVLKGETIAYGQNKSDCKANAQANLEDAYIALQAPMVIRLAKDGTVFCARWLNATQMEYWIQHPDGSGSGCVGNCETSLQRFMDRTVEDYNTSCGLSIPHVHSCPECQRNHTCYANGCTQVPSLCDECADAPEDQEIPECTACGNTDGTCSHAS